MTAVTQLEPTEAERPPAAPPMIRLVELTKHYPGQQHPAVDRINLDVPRGEIIVLVGPSGCGKTTTMELINRLIEPTSGQIILDGKDVTRENPDELRRRIGYVIQQVGLFPHLRVSQNIGVVPKLLGWSRSRINERVDELLDLVGLDPGSYRSRYPKELSGGQRQRVGVARAMAADPLVMLMDEPFGAIDPITRGRLQQEFLRVQQRVNKTIVFVTHDIDEAILMGDRIAVLGDQSHIAQYDTPENILANPADSYVADFIGSGASLRRLSLRRVRDVQLETTCPTVAVHDSPAQARQRLLGSGWTALLALDAQRRPRRWIDADDLTGATDGLERAGLPAVALVRADAALSEALDAMLTSNAGVAIVVDGHDAYQGLVNLDTIMAEVRSTRAARGGFRYATRSLRPAGDH